MKVLVLGGSGATGRLLIQQLLQKGGLVIAIVRNAEAFNELIGAHQNLQIIEAGIAEMSEDDLLPILADCDAVLCCLGHNLTFKGIFGKPRRLVTNVMNTVVRCVNSRKGDAKTKVVLMNTTGNSNRDIPEKPPLSQRLVIGLLRYLLPPHVDNEHAADILRIQVGQSHPTINWVVVRPDGLIDEDKVSAYDLYPSPIRNVIFDAGKTSRINVAHFMSELLVDTVLWERWQGRMPVIYNHHKPGE